MSEWITDRLPTYEDGFLYEGYVWVWMVGIHDAGPRTYVVNHYDVQPGQPWAPIEPPADYVNTEARP